MVLWHFSSRCPIQVQALDAEPMEIADDRGVPVRLVTLRLVNRSGDLLQFKQREIQVRVRVGERWESGDVGWGPSAIGPADAGPRYSKATMAVLVPRDATACRVSLYYDIFPKEPLSWRFLDWLSQRHNRFYRKLYNSPVIGSWLAGYTRRRGAWWLAPPAPEWRHLTLPKTPLPL
jgi:hypothetical protein